MDRCAVALLLRARGLTGMLSAWRMAHGQRHPRCGCLPARLVHMQSGASGKVLVSGMLNDSADVCRVAVRGCANGEPFEVMREVSKVSHRRLQHTLTCPPTPPASINKNQCAAVAWPGLLPACLRQHGCMAVAGSNRMCTIGNWCLSRWEWVRKLLPAALAWGACHAMLCAMLCATHAPCLPFPACVHACAQRGRTSALTFVLGGKDLTAQAIPDTQRAIGAALSTSLLRHAVFYGQNDITSLLEVRQGQGAEGIVAGAEDTYVWSQGIQRC